MKVISLFALTVALVLSACGKNPSVVGIWVGDLGRIDKELKMELKEDGTGTLMLDPSTGFGRMLGGVRSLPVAHDLNAKTLNIGTGDFTMKQTLAFGKDSDTLLLKNLATGETFIFRRQ